MVIELHKRILNMIVHVFAFNLMSGFIYLFHNSYLDIMGLFVSFAYLGVFMFSYIINVGDDVRYNLNHAIVYGIGFILMCAFNFMLWV